jgi:hypothetical protein
VELVDDEVFERGRCPGHNGLRKVRSADKGRTPGYPLGLPVRTRVGKGTFVVEEIAVTGAASRGDDGLKNSAVGFSEFVRHAVDLYRYPSMTR